jgi:hypothetical protein
MSNWQNLLEMARLTPPERNRYVDFLRVVAIMFVVTGHWLALVVTVDGEGIHFGHLITVAHWAQWLSWLFQVMPVFFFVGGYANSASWSSTIRKGAGYPVWLGDRLARLLVPVVPLVVFWAAAGLIAWVLGYDPDMATYASRAALIPVWFLAVYIIVTMLTPLEYAFWQRAGMASFWVFFAGAVAVDAIAIIFDAMWVRWVNYGFVWLAAHQLGFAWRDGRLETAGSRLLIIGVGLAGLAVLIGLLSYPIAMVSVPGQPVSNSRPPSFILLALGMVQIGVLVSLAGPARRMLQNETIWAAVIAGNRFIMTLFLWHMTALFACIGVSWLFLGGFGLRLEPGTGAWWWAKIPWFLVMGGVTGVLVMLMSRFEHISKASGKAGSALVAVTGAVLACFGLIQMAMVGAASVAAPGVNLAGVGAVFLGTFLVLNPGIGHRGGQ